MHAVLVECAQAATRTRHCRFRGYQNTLTVRQGYKRAIVATARKMLRVIYAVLRCTNPYRQPGDRLRSTHGPTKRAALDPDADEVRHRPQDRRDRATGPRLTISSATG